MRIRLLLAVALPCITAACGNPLADLFDGLGSPRQPMGIGLLLGPLLSDSSERVSRYVLSPDGSEAYYVTWAGAYTLRVVNRTTGARRTLVTGPCHPNQFAPSASGSHLYVAWSDSCDQYGRERGPSRLYRISVSSGTVELALDGRRLAFVVTACRSYSFDNPCYPYSGLFTVNLTQLGGDQGSGSLTASGPDGSIDAPVFTPDATHVVYGYNGTLRVSVVP